MVKLGENYNKRVPPARTQTLSANNNSMYISPHKRFISAEIDGKRANGVCFWCDEKYTFGQKCANKRLYSLIMELTEEEYDSVQVEE